MSYNFCRVHQTLRVTPAMESGLSNHVWSIAELCGLLPTFASSAKAAENKLVLKAFRYRIASVYRRLGQPMEIGPYDGVSYVVH
jgi:hypothetical protein